MTELPQIHDWLVSLLTPGQWLFAYIMSALVLWVWVGVRFKEPGIGFASGIVTFPIVWGILYLIACFMSFMIYLLMSGV